MSGTSSFNMWTTAPSDLLAWLGLHWVGPLFFSFVHVGRGTHSGSWVLAPHSDEISGKGSGVRGLMPAGLCEPCWCPGHSLKAGRGRVPLSFPKIGRPGGLLGWGRCKLYLLAVKTKVQAPIHSFFLESVTLCQQNRTFFSF